MEQGDTIEGEIRSDGEERCILDIQSSRGGRNSKDWAGFGGLTWGGGINAGIGGSDRLYYLAPENHKGPGLL